MIMKGSKDMLSNTMNFSAFLNGKIIRIHHHIGQILMNEVSLKLPHDICAMSLSPDKLFVVYSNIRHDGFHVFKDELQFNNVEAYDFSGKLVWRIKDIWENSKTLPNEKMREGTCFFYVIWHTGETLAANVPRVHSKWNVVKEEFKIEAEHEYLECHSIYDHMFIIDLTEKEIKVILRE